MKNFRTSQFQDFFFFTLLGFLFLIPILIYFNARPHAVYYGDLVAILKPTRTTPLFLVSGVAWLLALAVSPPSKPLRATTAFFSALCLLSAVAFKNFYLPPLLVAGLAFGAIYCQWGRKKIVLMLSAPVIIVYGIIQWFAVQQFLEQGKHVSMIRADQRSMATAIEAYFLDHGAYPPHTYDYSQAIWHSKTRIPTLSASTVGSLTTPIGYIEEYMIDPFCLLAEDEYRTFAYYQAGDNWILFSPGPNDRFELQPDILESILTTQTALLKNLQPYTYDPSNGTDSAGDVWRIKQ